ncbi:DedA family protein [Alkalihalobacillus sp. AL-G]|uniref:DedA family protein n=1 Tax=Alkalihalobacillus sp. AL-G TaxID=2926399 RepID=UPI002729D01C|nr:VTT domain-containing protein [Alkalihalobacillus sp. AL-G]WLD94690.1 VTT domain-containing protein [Alkalihalobacillus sp. AL-G]
MIDFMIDILKNFGMWGLFTSMAVEASSLPFPGAIVSLLYGYLLNPSWLDLISLAIFASVVYTIFSFIPYLIGYMLEDKLKEKLNRKNVEKSQKYFQKFGRWTIAVARPFGIGNYLSYVAGISKVNPPIFAALTFIGILPMTFLMLWLGRSGHVESVHKFMSQFQTLFWLIIGISVIIYVGFKIKKKKPSPGSKYEEAEQNN